MHRSSRRDFMAGACSSWTGLGRMWDYPIPGVGSEHWPGAEVSPGKNLGWDMWIGPARKRNFSAERYFEFPPTEA